MNEVSLFLNFFVSIALVVAIYHLVQAKHLIRQQQAKLDAIAHYPDPDFDAGGPDEEIKRAWQIIYQLKRIAGWELQL